MKPSEYTERERERENARKKAIAAGERWSETTRMRPSKARFIWASEWRSPSPCACNWREASAGIHFNLIGQPPYFI